MGQSVSWLSGLLWAKKEIRILILGLVCRLLSFPVARGSPMSKNMDAMDAAGDANGW
jgi:hypothetical protein